MRGRGGGGGSHRAAHHLGTWLLPTSTKIGQNPPLLGDNRRGRSVNMTMKDESEISDELRYREGYVAGLEFALGKTGAEVTQQQDEKKTDPVLIGIWEQLNEDMRHRENLYMQLIVALFLFMGAAGALITYNPTLRWWVWGSGVAILVAGWVYVGLIARGQRTSRESALGVQRSFRVSGEIAESLERFMRGRKQTFSSLPGRIIWMAVTGGLWIYLGHLVVFSS